MFVKPAPNPARPGEVLLVRVPPHMAPMPPGGANVPDTMFWHRALLRGDVVAADSPQVEADKAATAKAATDKAAEAQARLNETAATADAAARKADADAEAANEAAGIKGAAA